MTDAAPSGDDLVAGDFGRWLTGLRGAIAGDGTSDVPCDGCTACCRSAQFVHIAPDEHDTLAHIPRPLLFPAPGLPRGHVVLGYDERGWCPMLTESGCSIYEHRPRACRVYDCRVFTATGITVGDDKPLIAERVRRWRFRVAAESDRARQRALRAAAAFVDQHRTELGDAPIPANPPQLAALAVELHELFLGTDEPDVARVRTAVAEARARLATR